MARETSLEKYRNIGIMAHIDADVAVFFAGLWNSPANALKTP